MMSFEPAVSLITEESTSCRMDRSLWSWANAYKVSFAIFALNDLGILRALAGRRLTTQEIAAEFQLDEELVAPLLELLGSIALVQENEHGYRVPSGVETVLPLLAMESRVSATHVTARQIAEVVRSGSAADIFQKGDVQEYLPIFTAAMRSSARTLAPHLVRFAGMRQCRRMVDLGGADGSLAIAIQRMAPGLAITVVDLPRMAEAFQKQVTENGAQTTIQFHQADLRKPQTVAALLPEAGVIVASNVIHLLTTEQRNALFRQVLVSAAPGTRLMIYDQFIADRETLGAANFMAVDWVINGVRFHENTQGFCAKLSALGFTDVQSRQFTGLPGAVISARV